MTWKEFKELVEGSGIKDDFEVDAIDISYPTESEILESIKIEDKSFSIW